jgi:hypothetical protein
MDQIHLSPLVDQIQLTLGHIANKKELEHNIPYRSAGELYSLFVWLVADGWC